jgi:hypothetical protein
MVMVKDAEVGVNANAVGRGPIEQSEDVHQVKSSQRNVKSEIGVEVNYVNYHYYCSFLSASFALASSAAIFARSLNSNLRAHS